MNQVPTGNQLSSLALARPGFGVPEIEMTPAASTRESQIESPVLVEVAVAVVPAMGLVGFGQPELGGKVFFLILFLLLARHALFKRPLEYSCLMLGVLPALMLLRGFFFYNSMILILCIGIGLWLLFAPRDFARLWGDLRWKSLLFLGGLYWLISFYLTGIYSVNFRILELIFSVAAVCLLAGQRRLLATAFLGIGLSAVAIGIAFLPYGMRLGSGEIGDYSLGNPISFGIPLALILVLCIADNGKWLLLGNRPFHRLALGLVAAGFLVLSTSRGSWAVVVACIMSLLLFDRKQRKQLILPLALLPVLVIALLGTGRGAVVERFFEKTFSSESSLTHSTSGRSDQWELFPRVFMDSPLIGFGPGSGKSVYARYSLENYSAFHAGDMMAWHSLYLQLGVETGFIGLLALALVLGPLVFEKGIHWRLYGESLPFLGVLSFLVVALSVSAMDGVSGVFLGLGFLGGRHLHVRDLIKRTKTKNYRLRKLSKELVSDHLDQFELIDADTSGQPWGSAEWLVDLPDKWNLSWVVMRGEEPIGFLVASRKADALHIHRLAVIARERCKSFGQMLVAAAAWRALNSGCVSITLKVHKSNAGAIAFYTRLGFVNSGRQRENLLLTAESARVFDLS